MNQSLQCKVRGLLLYCAASALAGLKFARDLKKPSSLQFKGRFYIYCSVLKRLLERKCKLNVLKLFYRL